MPSVVYEVLADPGRREILRLLLDGVAGGIRLLLTSRRWIHFLFLAFLGGIGAFSAASYLFPYMAGLGASDNRALPC